MTTVKPRQQTPDGLADGEYVAKCRQKSLIGAAANGHSSVWPESMVVVFGGVATFYQLNKVVWVCNPNYAATHFDISTLTTGWFTSATNRAGTAHYFRVPGLKATSLCGRTVNADDLQGENESLRKCGQCLKAKSRG